MVLPCSLPFVSHGCRRGLGHTFAPTLDRRCVIRLEARRTVGNCGLFWIYSGPHEGAAFVINSVMSCDLPLSWAASWKLVCDTRRPAGKGMFGCRGRCHGPREDVATDAIHLAWRWRRRWASVETYLLDRWSDTLRLKLRASHGSYQVCNVVCAAAW